MFSLLLSLLIHITLAEPSRVLTTPKAEAQGIPPTEALPIRVISIDDLVHQTVIKYGLNYQHFYGTLSCESEGFKDVAIQSQVPDAGSPDGLEQSYGVAQIYLPAHPDISYANATDPVWAIDYAGKMFSEGRENQFHCYKILQARDWQ